MKDPVQAPEFFDYSNSARCGQFADNCMLPPLIVRGRTPQPWWCSFELESFKVSVEREIKIQAGLFAIGDHVHSRCELIVYRRDHRILLQFQDIGPSELIKMLAGEFQPCRERVAAYDRGAQRTWLHKPFSRDGHGLRNPQRRKFLPLDGLK
jgi:hypothetical protein